MIALVLAALLSPPVPTIETSAHAALPSAPASGRLSLPQATATPQPDCVVTLGGGASAKLHCVAPSGLSASAPTTSLALGATGQTQVAQASATGTLTTRLTIPSTTSAGTASCGTAARPMTASLEVGSGAATRAWSYATGSPCTLVLTSFTPNAGAGHAVSSTAHGSLTLTLHPLASAASLGNVTVDISF